MMTYAARSVLRTRQLSCDQGGSLGGGCGRTVYMKPLGVSRRSNEPRAGSLNSGQNFDDRTHWKCTVVFRGWVCGGTSVFQFQQSHSFYTVVAARERLTVKRSAPRHRTAAIPIISLAILALTLSMVSYDTSMFAVRAVHLVWHSRCGRRNCLQPSLPLYRLHFLCAVRLNWRPVSAVRSARLLQLSHRCDSNSCMLVMVR
jgi:hypothetical protein